MAIREIRLSNDEILRKTSREVETVDDRIWLKPCTNIMELD